VSSAKQTCQVHAYSYFCCLQVPFLKFVDDAEAIGSIYIRLRPRVFEKGETIYR
jgi:hypothetical protein